MPSVSTVVVVVGSRYCSRLSLVLESESESEIDGTGMAPLPTISFKFSPIIWKELVGRTIDPSLLVLVFSKMFLSTSTSMIYGLWYTAYCICILILRVT